MDASDPSGRPASPEGIRPSHPRMTPSGAPHRPRDRLVRYSLASTLVGLGFFAALLLRAAHPARERMLLVAGLTLGGFAFTLGGVLGFFLVGVRHFTRRPEDEPSAPRPR